MYETSSCIIFFPKIPQNYFKPPKTKNKMEFVTWEKNLSYVPKYNHDLVTLRPQTSTSCKKSKNEHKTIGKIIQIFKEYTLFFQPFNYSILQCKNYY